MTGPVNRADGIACFAGVLGAAVLPSVAAGRGRDASQDTLPTCYGGRGLVGRRNLLAAASGGAWPGSAASELCPLMVASNGPS
jgi:hypothetical protein